MAFSAGPGWSNNHAWTPVVEPFDHHSVAGIGIHVGMLGLRIDLPIVSLCGSTTLACPRVRRVLVALQHNLRLLRY
jgi:hypothetical protein